MIAPADSDLPEPLSPTRQTIFSLPGLGQLAYQAVIQRDLNTLMGIIFLSSLIVVLVNFLTDLLYARLDSRIELK